MTTGRTRVRTVTAHDPHPRRAETEHRAMNELKQARVNLPFVSRSARTKRFLREHQVLTLEAPVLIGRQGKAATHRNRSKHQRERVTSQPTVSHALRRALVPARALTTVRGGDATPPRSRWTATGSTTTGSTGTRRRVRHRDGELRRDRRICRSQRRSDERERHDEEQSLHARSSGCSPNRSMSFRTARAAACSASVLDRPSPWARCPAASISTKKRCA